MQDSDPDLVRPATLSARSVAGPRDDAFERIAPMTLDPPGTRPASQVIDGATVSTRAVLFGVALLVLLAGLLLVQLPKLLGTPLPAAGVDSEPATVAADATDRASGATADTAAETAAAAAASAVSAAPPDVAAMAADESLLRARQQAQELAGRAAALIRSLEAQAVRRWAATAFAAATAQHDRAAKAFEQRDFAAAASGHGTAVAALEALAAEAPKQLAAAKQMATESLARGDLDTAANAVALALAIAPDDAGARRLQARVASFPAVQSALQRAATAEAAGDGQAAAVAYREALAADADNPVAKAALARIDGDQAAARFRATMAGALAALDGGRLDDADRELKSAARMRPGDAGVADAASRLARLRREQTLARLEASAHAAADAEDWDGAVRDYGALLAADPSAAAAQAGLALARPRAALASRIDSHLAQPARLSSDSVHTDAARALAEAQAIAAPGPKLRAQVVKLAALLATAATPVEVRLVSDGATEVTIYKVGPQGRFKDKALALKPGRYTAVGARAGHVDVRVEFTVEAGSVPPTVAIRCEEKL
jgi:hypothetical protein